jgi:hypothetical protein
VEGWDGERDDLREARGVFVQSVYLRLAVPRAVAGVHTWGQQLDLNGRQRSVPTRAKGACHVGGQFGGRDLQLHGARGTPWVDRAAAAPSFTLTPTTTCQPLAHRLQHTPLRASMDSLQHTPLRASMDRVYSTRRLGRVWIAYTTRR